MAKLLEIIRKELNEGNDKAKVEWLHKAESHVRKMGLKKPLQWVILHHAHGMGHTPEQAAAHYKQQVPHAFSEEITDAELDSMLTEGGPTRKHFRQVASIIAQHPDPAKRKELAAHHAAIFASQNPRFNHHIWNKACNVSEAVQYEEVSDDELDALYDTTEYLVEEDVDHHKVNELILHADNTAHLYHGSHQPIIKNLRKKVKKGIYDPEKAKKLWYHHATRAAQDYHREHGDPHTKWHHMFPTSVRRAAAHHWEEANREEVHQHDEQVAHEGEVIESFSPGQRVQMHPATDLWMRGARYGDVHHVDKHGHVHVKLDKLPHKTVKVHPDNLIPEGVDLDEGVRSLSPKDAHDILEKHGGAHADFFSLPSHHVHGLLQHAKLLSYRKSRYAPGSTARMFHQALRHRAAHHVSEGLVFEATEHELMHSDKFKASREHLYHAVMHSQEHSRLAGEALKKYGSHGSLISGVVRDHFPEHVKTALRHAAHKVTHHSDEAWKARPKGVHNSTMRKLSRAVARHHGHGFYGPQP